MLTSRPSRSARAATASTRSRTSRTWSADCVVTRNSTGFAPFSTFARHEVIPVTATHSTTTTRPSRPGPAPARVPDRLHAEPGEQQQREQRVQHEPREALVRPAVDGEREREVPDQEQLEQGRAAQRGDGPDRAEQQHGPLLREEDDEVEVPLLLAAALAVLAEPVGEPVVQAVPEAGRVRQEDGEEDREDRGERRQRPDPRLPSDGADRPHQRRLGEPVPAPLHRERERGGTCPPRTP